MDIEKEIIHIQQRNQRVELEKAWETSTTRYVSIVVITYLFAVLVMYALDIARPLINAVIPTLGYFLSVQSLPLIKRWWLTKQK
ncbi:hypothetical protein KC866_01000 [Patescibacteria group bacterium]|nr:hypothetical protein [Patescibacteria group bacterium]